MMAHELKYVIDNMDKKDAAGKSGFENQFEVRMLSAKIFSNWN